MRQVMRLCSRAILFQFLSTTSFLSFVLLCIVEKRYATYHGALYTQHQTHRCSDSRRRDRGSRFLEFVCILPPSTTSSVDTTRTQILPWKLFCVSLTDKRRWQEYRFRNTAHLHHHSGQGLDLRPIRSDIRSSMAHP